MSYMADLVVQVDDVVGGQLHGDMATYTPQSGSPVRLYIKSLEKDFETEFDDTERDYNEQVFQFSQTLIDTPRETARSGVGDSFVFDDTPTVTWYVREVVVHARAGGFHVIRATQNYRGPRTR